MAPSVHSAFPASSSTRLINCPGSYAAGQAIQTGRNASVFSAQGTLAHAFSEAALLTGADPVRNLGRTFQTDGFAITPDAGFIDAVQVYVDFVNNLRALGFLVALEVRVTPQVHWTGLKALNIELFGTSDCVAYHPDRDELLIADLKFGAGVPVEVRDNDQLRYYAAGTMHHTVVNELLARHGRLSEVRTPAWKPSAVRTVLVQPRAPHPDGPVRSATYTADEIVDFARDRLYQGVVRALSDGGQTFVSGKHCRFCPVKAHCPAHRQEMVELARQTFLALPPTNEPVSNLLGVEQNKQTEEAKAPAQAGAVANLPHLTLTDEMLGKLMDRVAILKPYIAAIEAMVEARALTKKDAVPGWVAAPTAPRRQWGENDENKLKADLLNAGLTEADFSETVLLSPAQVQRRIGRKRYDQSVAPLVGRTSSGVKIVPVSDPRAPRARQTPQEAFGLPAPRQKEE